MTRLPHFESARRGLPAVLLVCVCALGLGASPALAARGHTLGFAFGAPGTGNGQLQEPYGIAVDEATGDVYVVDRGNNRVEVFDGEGHYLFQFNGSGTFGEGVVAGHGGLEGEVESGQFEHPTEIAVDNSCHYHKLTGTACEKFDPSDGDVYVIDEGHRVVDKYTATGEYVGQITEDSEKKRFVQELYGVAVGSDGRVYVTGVVEGETLRSRVFEFSNATHNGCGGCEVGDIETEGSGTDVTGFLGHGLAVDASGDVFVPILRLGAPSGVVEYAPAGEKLRELATPSWGLAVEIGSGDVYIGSGSEVDRFGSDGAELEELAVAGLQGGGVAVNGSSGDVFASNGAAGVVDVFGLEPPGAPTVVGGGVTEVTSVSARVQAEVNPRGAATGYWVQYGKCVSPGDCVGAGFEDVAPVAHGFAGSGFELERVSVLVQGLAPRTTYHFEVLASNEAGGHVNTVVSGVGVFTTQSPGGTLELPDARVWELVSPASKDGAEFEPLGQLSPTQAAPDGDAITYAASTPTESGVAGFDNKVQMISKRGAAGGWESVDVTVPHEAPVGKSVSVGQEYRLFSEDLSRGIVQPFGEFVPFVSGASGQTAYVRTNFAANGGFCGEDCYRPLVTGCPGAGKRCEAAVSELADVPAGTDFTLTGEECEKDKICGPEARAASSDLSAVLLESGVGLTAGTSGGLYEWFDGRLHYVSAARLQDLNAFAWVGDGGTEAIYGDIAGESPLQLVEPLSGQGVELDAGTCAGCESGGGADPWVVDGGARVFFRDARKLSEGSDSGTGAYDLYECDVTVKPVGCRLSDLTPKAGTAHADVLGIVGVDEDGSSVYFVANGKLTEGAVQGTCVEGATKGGECNLYVEQRTGAGWSEPRLVAVVSGDDEPDWRDVMERHTARVTGEWLVFMSDRSLTGYDNEDVVGDRPDEEVYEYHAQGTGDLVCVSCNPTGERPHGIEYQKLGLTVADDTFVWQPAQWLSGSVPGWTPYSDEIAAYDSRFLSPSGRVFFNSTDALVPQDVNGTEDVYEYEPPGVGSCRTESVSYSESSGGCVELISSGESAKESGFLDASADGSDVFFLTYSRLSSEDRDNAMDVYDAHECSASAPCPSPPPVPAGECETESACRPAPTPQPSIFGAPPSATFSGPGNLAPARTPAQTKTTATATKHKPLTRAQKLAKALKQCRKDGAKAKRGSCERQARARFGLTRKTKR